MPFKHIHLKTISLFNDILNLHQLKNESSERYLSLVFVNLKHFE
jgi:hypothetical protein